MVSRLFVGACTGDDGMDIAMGDAPPFLEDSEIMDVEGEEVKEGVRAGTGVGSSTRFVSVGRPKPATAVPAVGPAPTTSPAIAVAAAAAAAAPPNTAIVLCLGGWLVLE